MKAERRRDQINNGWRVRDFQVAEDFRPLQVSALVLQFDFSPIINGLKNYLAVGRGFQFNDDQASVFTQSEQINSVARGAKLIVNRRENQIAVK